MTRRPGDSAVGVGGSSTFALLGEALLVGAVVAVASIPLVTVVPALAAGVRHLRRHLAGENDSVGDLLRGVAYAVRRLWLIGFALPALLLLLGFNLWFARASALPGASVVTVVSWLLGAVVVVAVLRFVGSWSPREPWPTQLQAAAGRAWHDMPGSGLLLCAVATAGVLVWMLVPMVLVVGGLLAFAALSVESRGAARRV